MSNEQIKMSMTFEAAEKLLKELDNMKDFIWYKSKDNIYGSKDDHIKTIRTLQGEVKAAVLNANGDHVANKGQFTMRLTSRELTSYKIN